MKYRDSVPARLVLGMLIAYLCSTAAIFFFLEYEVSAGLTNGVDASLVGERLRRTFLLAASGVSLFGLGVGLLLARRFRKRVDGFNRLTRDIVQSGDLSGRMPVVGSDEFSTLACNMNAMLERIEKLVQGIHQVSDNIAHDLRTPLTRLGAEVQVALRDDDPSAHRNALQRVHAEVEKMQAIFNSLLAIGRAESGGVPIKSAVMDFSQLLGEMVELYTPSAEECGLSLAEEIEPGLLVSGNRQLLAQVVSNLLDNALKYVPAGGIVKLRADRDGEQVKVVVEDSGPGIPGELRDKVFERFMRVDPARTIAGAGLGLSLAKAFVDLHHGRLFVADSSLGGSAFTIELPATRGVPKPSAAVLPAPG